MQSALSDFYSEVPETSIIREVTEAEIYRVVDLWVRGKAIIRGLFLARTDSRWTACDNRTQSFEVGCYVEEFRDRRTAVAWLRDEPEGFACRGCFGSSSFLQASALRRRP